jgi:16S rRNA processing protein RimM
MDRVSDVPRRLLVGRIGKPHGLTGEVYVEILSDDPGRFRPGAELWRATGDRLVVDRIRPHRDRTLVGFAGVGTRDAAEALRGPLYIPASEARTLEDGEFWTEDLVGLEVRLVNGTGAGRVVDVLPGAAHDLLAVEDGPKRSLVPMVSAIVVEVDPAAGKVVLDPPAGLLD